MQVVQQKLEKKLTSKLAKLTEKIKGKKPASPAQQLRLVLESAETPAELLEAPRHFGLATMQQLGGLLENEQSMTNLRKRGQPFGEVLGKL